MITSTPQNFLRSACGLVLLIFVGCAGTTAGQARSTAARRIIALAAAAESTCAILEGGKVACVGRTGTLNNLPGLYPDSPVAQAATEMPLPFNAKQLAIAANRRSMHACALAETGRIYCWGLNTEGQLGPATEVQMLTDLAAKSGLKLKALADYRPAALAGEIPLQGKSLQVVTGYAHSCALSEWEYVECWGSNIFGQLGQDRRQPKGRREQSREPVFVSVLTSAETKSGLRIRQLAAGANHNCALLSDGNVRCWGSNYFGQLGHAARPVEGRGPDEAMLVPEPPDVMGNAKVLGPVEKKAGIVVTSIAAHGDRSCAVLSNGRARCWGQNLASGLGYPNEPFDKISQLKEPHQLGDILLSEAVTTIAMSRVHSCALSVSGEVYCWGSGTQGQLGDPTLLNTEKPGSMPPRAVALRRGGESETMQALALGEGHSCAQLASGKMRCWGQGFDGQLGTGPAKKIGKVACRNFSPTCLGDEPGELPPPDVNW